jgi:hypothetical protein
MKAVAGYILFARGQQVDPYSQTERKHRKGGLEITAASCNCKRSEHHLLRADQGRKGCCLNLSVSRGFAFWEIETWKRNQSGLVPRIYVQQITQMSPYGGAAF